MGSRKWVSSAPCRPITFQRRILSLQLIVLSLSPCWMPSQVGTMALDSTGMVPSPGKDQQHTLAYKPGCGIICFHLHFMTDHVHKSQFLLQYRASPFSTLVRSLPCLAFSNRGWWPWASSPASLHDLSNRAPSPHGAVLRMREKGERYGIAMMHSQATCSLGDETSQS